VGVNGKLRTIETVSMTVGRARCINSAGMIPSVWLHPLRERRLRRRDGNRADVSETADLLVALLDDPLRWRERVIEELTLESSAYVRVVTSYLLDFPPDLLSPVVDLRTYRSANMLVPLGTRAKSHLFLNLDITGPGGVPASRLSRKSVASLQAEYLRLLIETMKAPERVRRTVSRGMPEELLDAMCVFTPDYYQRLLASVKGDAGRALHTYLESGLGVGVSDDDVREWRKATKEVEIRLAPYAAWLPPTISAADEILLAIPHVEPIPRSPRAIGDRVHLFRDAVIAVTELEQPDGVLLRTLSEYGRRYEVVVEVEVPLLEPSTIMVREERPLGRGKRKARAEPLRPGEWIRQHWRPSDAESAHLQVRSADPNVEINTFELYDLDGKEVGLGPIESVRVTDDALALYTANEEAPEFATVWIHLTVRRHLDVIFVAFALLALGSAAVAILIPRDDLFVERLAILTLPATLAGTLVLAREQSGLASVLQSAARRWLGISLTIPWCVVLVLLLVVELDEPRASTGRRASARASAPPSTLSGKEDLHGKQRSTRPGPNWSRAR
jgi:hypothetical protein